VIHDITTGAKYLDLVERRKKRHRFFGIAFFLNLDVKRWIIKTLKNLELEEIYMLAHHDFGSATLDISSDHLGFKIPFQYV
jgi:hypothetical protein